jgi:hypothetical protein
LRSNPTSAASTMSPVDMRISEGRCFKSTPAKVLIEAAVS